MLVPVGSGVVPVGSGLDIVWAGAYKWRLARAPRLIVGVSDLPGHRGQIMLSNAFPAAGQKSLSWDEGEQGSFDLL